MFPEVFHLPDLSIETLIRDRHGSTFRDRVAHFFGHKSHMGVTTAILRLERLPVHSQLLPAALERQYPDRSCALVEKVFESSRWVWERVEYEYGSIVEGQDNGGVCEAS